MRKIFSVTMVSLCVICFAVCNSFAGVEGHYVNGVEGIKCGSLPGPGFYYKMYNALYTSDKLMDPSGNEADGIRDFDLTVFANVHRFVWVIDSGDPNSNFAFDIIIPIQKTDIDFMVLTPMGMVSVESDETGIGDPYAEAIYTWHAPQFDSAVGAGIYIPIGEYDEDELASPGKDMWTLMLSFSGTYFFDTEKTWAASILGRYEIHTEKRDADVKPGNDFHFEWGISKTLARIWDVGLVGYCQWQVTDDSGDGVAWDKGDHDKVYAMGPEVSVFIPPYKMLISLRTEFEFEAEDRTEGDITTLTFTKIF